MAGAGTALVRLVAERAKAPEMCRPGPPAVQPLDQWRRHRTCTPSGRACQGPWCCRPGPPAQRCSPPPPPAAGWPSSCWRSCRDGAIRAEASAGLKPDHHMRPLVRITASFTRNCRTLDQWLPPDSLRRCLSVLSDCIFWNMTSQISSSRYLPRYLPAGRH